MALTLHRSSMTSPLGGIVVVSNGEAIVRLHMQGDAEYNIALRQAQAEQDAAAAAGREAGDALSRQAVAELAEYFAGSRQVFDLPVALEGTPFQQRIWAELLQIPYGQLSSYGLLAAGAGNPAASRAVGGAVGANPVPIIVPCHRILASDGRITGYSGGQGIPTKRILLELEGISYKA